MNDLNVETLLFITLHREMYKIFHNSLTYGELAHLIHNELLEQSAKNEKLHYISEAVILEILYDITKTLK